MVVRECFTSSHLYIVGAHQHKRVIIRSQLQEICAHKAYALKYHRKSNENHLNNHGLSSNMYDDLISKGQRPKRRTELATFCPYMPSQRHNNTYQHALRARNAMKSHEIQCYKHLLTIDNEVYHHIIA